MSCAMSPEVQRKLSHLCSMPGRAHTTMTRAELRELLLATDGCQIAAGQLYDITSKNLGAGVYDVALKERVRDTNGITAPARTVEEKLANLAARFNPAEIDSETRHEFAIFATACLAGMPADGDLERFALACFAAGYRRANELAANILLLRMEIGGDEL